MFGNLSAEETEEVLQHELVGRIGCSADNIVYVVPTSYVYDGNSIYCHSMEGMKMDMMRKNPAVCFEVDKLEDLGNWKSVIAWGTFHDITDNEERKKALHLLLNRPLPFITSKTMQLGNSWPFTSEEKDTIEGVMFRIDISSKSGRFEAYEHFHSFVKG